MSDKKKKPEEYILEIQLACAKLGWNIGITNEDDLSGLIIGKTSFIKEVVSQLEEIEEYEIWSCPEKDDKLLH